MSAPHVITVDSQQYLVVDDNSTRYTAIAYGDILDEVTGRPPSTTIAVQTGRPDVTAHVTEGGLFAVAGIVEQIAFPITVALTFTANGYRIRTLLVPIPASPVLPIDAGTVQLRPMPVRLQGRVVQNTVTRTPIPNATVAVVTSGAIALRTPLHFDHAALVVVRQRVLNLAGAVKALVADAPGESVSIRVSSLAGIVAGSVLQMGLDVDTEYVVVAALGTAPGEVLLNAPLWRTFMAGSPVQRVTKGAIGATTALARFADRGDGLLLLSAPMPFSTLEVVDGANSEYAVPNALTNADGFYRLDAIGGAVELDLRASAAAFIDLQVPWSLDFAQPVNVVSFRLST